MSVRSAWPGGPVGTADQSRAWWTSDMWHRQEVAVKGIVFDLLQQAVSNTYGEDTWDALLDDAGLDGAYTAVGSYPDEQLLALVGAGAKKFDIDADALTRWFGRACVPLLSRRYATFFAPHTSTRAFLLTL